MILSAPLPDPTADPGPVMLVVVLPVLVLTVHAIWGLRLIASEEVRAGLRGKTRNR